MSATPDRILFLHPDTYGDLILFEPVLRIVRDAWPQTEIAVLIREPYFDITRLLAADAGVKWLTTDCNPYRREPHEDREALVALRNMVTEFSPDWLVAACFEHTWLETAIAMSLPDVRQCRIGGDFYEPAARSVLAGMIPDEGKPLYADVIPVAPETLEWEKNLQLASGLIGREAGRWWPVAQVPDEAVSRAVEVIAAAELRPGNFVACCAAGIANVQIKSWPAASYAEAIAWLEREHGVRALLLGHESERQTIEAVQGAAVALGANPALWLGQTGQMPVLAGLLSSARFYFGNDTGAVHLAAALGLPVASIFGGGHWPRFKPVARRSVTVVQPLPCFGCAWDCFFGDAPCVSTISVASVKVALEQFLADHAEGECVFEAQGMEASVRALIDKATPRLVFERQDRLDRFRHNQELSAQAIASRAQYESQLEELTSRLLSSEDDRLARLRDVERLAARLAASEKDRNARLAQVKELDAQLRESESDRARRQEQIAEIGASLASSEADRGARLRQTEELKLLLAQSEADRDARLRQVETLTPLLLESESDRAARGALIVELSTRIHEMDERLQEQDRRIVELTSTAELAHGPHLEL